MLHYVWYTDTNNMKILKYPSLWQHDTHQKFFKCTEVAVRIILDEGNGFLSMLQLSYLQCLKNQSITKRASFKSIKSRHTPFNWKALNSSHFLDIKLLYLSSSIFNLSHTKKQRAGLASNAYICSDTKSLGDSLFCRIWIQQQCKYSTIAE